MPKPNLIEQTTDYLDARFTGRRKYAEGAAINVIASIAANSLKTDVTCPLLVRTNMYVLICGPTTTGKTTVIGYGQELLELAGYRNVIGDDITPESLPKYLHENKHVQIRIAEMSKLLGSYKKKQFMSGLREMLIQAWDGGILTQSRSTRAHLEAKDYAVSASADTQPQVIALSADESDIQSGFLVRFMWFLERNPTRVSPRVLSDYQLKQKNEIVARLKKIYHIAEKNSIRFRFSQNQVDQISERMQASAPTEMFMFQAFYDRCTDFVYKLAMLHMFGSDTFIERSEEWGDDEDREDFLTNILQEEDKEKHIYVMDIDNESVEWAIQYTQKYADEVLPDIFKILTLNDGEKVRDAVKLYNQEHDSRPMPESIMYRVLIHSMRDFNRMRNAIELARRMHYVFPVRGHGGTSYQLHKEKGTSVFDFVVEDTDDSEEDESGLPEGVGVNPKDDSN